MCVCLLGSPFVCLFACLCDCLLLAGVLSCLVGRVFVRLSARLFGCAVVRLFGGFC